MLPHARYGHYRRIQFCTDFSENANLAFGLALEAAERNPGSVLTLLHVLPEPGAQFWKGYIYEIEDIDSQAREAIDAEIESQYLPHVPPGVDFRRVFRVGNPAQVILDFAREDASDLIVVGRQGRGSVFFGNVASRVARYAECPVLVVPMAFAQRFHNPPPATS